MTDGRSKINDKDRVLSLLMFYLKKGDSEKQNFFTIATTAFSIALILLTVILTVNQFNNGIFKKYLFTFVSIIIMVFLIYVIIENRWYLNRIEKNKEKLRYLLEKYEIDEESEALIKIAFDETN